jgi:hypothetical protein
MPGKKTSIARCASLKRLTLLFIILTACLAFSWLQHSSAARQSSDNQPPVLTVPDKVVGKVNTEISFRVTASDFDSFGPVGITADGLPPGANFETVAQSNNTTVGIFSWTATAHPPGSSFKIYVLASDGELSDTEEVTIQLE